MLEMTQERKDTTVRQKQILAAARRLIVRYGSEHVTVRRMAQEIGVSEAAIYRHFKSKKDVLSFLVDDIENSLLLNVKTNITENGNALLALENIVLGHASSIEKRKGISFQVIAEIISLGDKKLNNKIYDCINTYIARIKDVMAGGVKDGTIRKDIDLDATATLFFGMIQGLANIWTLSHYSFKMETKFTPMWKIFRDAISNR
jgi:AcrR family transcriptional regulator